MQEWEKLMEQDVSQEMERRSKVNKEIGFMWEER